MDRNIYDDDHEAYRRAVRAFIGSHILPHYQGWERDGRAGRGLFLAAGETGAFGFGVPEQYGGSGIDDFRYNAVLAEEAASAGVAPAAVGLSLQADVWLPYLLSMGDDAQKRRWLPEVVRGAVITALAITEPGAGSDLSGIRTRADRDGEDYLLTGHKTFITNGVNSDLMIVAARTSDDRHGGLSLFLVETDTSGLGRSVSLRKIGMHVQDTAEIWFDRVRVPIGHRLGAEGAGFAGLTHNLAQERLSAAVSAVAVARAALEWTVTYVRERIAFGKPIGALQSTRNRLAELSTEVDLVQLWVDQCIFARNAHVLTPVDAAKAKWWSTEVQGRVLDGCLQLHGGYGYMLDAPIARAWMDSRATRIYGGTSEIMREIVGKSLNLA